MKKKLFKELKKILCFSRNDLVFDINFIKFHTDFSHLNGFLNFLIRKFAKINPIKEV